VEPLLQSPLTLSADAISDLGGTFDPSFDKIFACAPIFAMIEGAGITLLVLASVPLPAPTTETPGFETI
jgi:hypothetical protein